MKTLCVLLMGWFPQFVMAAPIEFESVWQNIRKSSPVLERESHLENASQAALDRASGHWLPVLGLNAQLVSTDEPASSFYSILSERKINASDFNPSSLNHPERSLYEKFSLGMDLPLYEGGGKVAALHAAEKVRELNRLEHDDLLIREYAAAAQAYANLGSIKSARERMGKLVDQVSSLLSKYSIGAESNPVGYSGMLGLRSLKNRAEGVLLELGLGHDSLQADLSERAHLEPAAWEVRLTSLSEFLDAKMPAKESLSESLGEKSAEVKSEMIEFQKTSESARFLPRLGLFAEEALVHGNRDTGSSLTGGVYLQWTLFNPENRGRVKEADEKSLASVAESRSVHQLESVERKTLVLTEASMRKSHELLIESERLLDDQVKVASRLFQAGSITALQLSEVLNRRVDLILSLRELEKNLIEIRARGLTLSRGAGVEI